MTQKTNREAWLLDAVALVRPIFSEMNYEVPDCQVSCGFASTGVKSGHIGQCWSRQSSRGEINQIFISPALSSPVEVLDTLVHELIHAVDDCQHKHGKEFKKMALKLGLVGPMRSASAGPKLKERLVLMAAKLGDYPHSALRVPAKVMARVNRPRARCSACGYQVPMLKKFLAFGPPICPKDKVPMQELGDWDAA